MLSFRLSSLLVHSPITIASYRIQSFSDFIAEMQFGQFVFCFFLSRMREKLSAAERT